jgi:hypothetical protein
MKDGKIGYRTADIEDSAVHGIEEHNFRGLNLPREIRMVAPVQVIKIGI